MRPRIVIPVGLLALLLFLLFLLRPRPADSTKWAGMEATDRQRERPAAGATPMPTPPLSAGKASTNAPSALPSPQASIQLPIDLDNVPISVRVILDLDADYLARLEAVQPLRLQITESEKSAIYKFLLRRNPEDESQKGHVLKNRLMDALCLQQPLPADLPDILSQIFHDPQQHVVLRDYAVQHMVPAYETMAGWPASDQRDGVLSSMRRVLHEALNETANSIAGTALLGMARLSHSTADFDHAELAASALALAGDANASELVHVTAIQLCGRLKVPNVLPMLMDRALSSSTVPVQLAAIAALGELGGTAEETLLKTLNLETNPRLRPAVQAAAIRIRNRLAGGGEQTVQSDP